MKPRAIPQPGIPARHDGTCPRCDQPIHVNDRVAFKRGRAVHVGCVGGAE